MSREGRKRRKSPWNKLSRQRQLSEMERCSMLRTPEGEEEAEGKEEEEEEYVETNNPTNKTGEVKDELREDEV